MTRLLTIPMFCGAIVLAMCTGAACDKKPNSPSQSTTTTSTPSKGAGTVGDSANASPAASPQDPQAATDEAEMRVAGIMEGLPKLSLNAGQKARIDKIVAGFMLEFSRLEGELSKLDRDARRSDPQFARLATRLRSEVFELLTKDQQEQLNGEFEAQIAKNAETVNMIKCAAQLKHISGGLQLFANDHHGMLPHDLGTLFLEQSDFVSLNDFICPSINIGVPPVILKGTLQEKAKWVNENSNYLFSGAGKTFPAAADTVLLYEKPINHGARLLTPGGMNIVFGDGRVEWRAQDEAARLVANLPTQKANSKKKQTPVAIASTKGSLAIVDGALDLFEATVGRYPTTEEGLRALMEAPANVTGWRGPYLKHAPTDFWDQPLVYRFPGVHNQNGPDVSSPGADGIDGTPDDINNWSQK